MTHGGNDLFHKILCGKPQGGGIHAGMAAKVFFLQHFPVDQQLYPVISVIHKAQNT